MQHARISTVPTLRDIHFDDLPAVQALNEAAVPAVNSLAMAPLQWLWEHAIYRRAAVDATGEVGGFLLGLGPGLAYASPNYRWFSARYPDFVYVDRIVVGAAWRNLGLGTQLYADIWQLAVHRGAVLACEVNLEPANPGSLRFHAKFGFRSVGEQRTEGGTKRVTLLVREPPATSE
ncbi:MAG: GNAT family N-acetyltransferase [Myxococcales bacterium]|nr:GNAT family N-acetyltransferase [Myxococcales bacterium]